MNIGGDMEFFIFELTNSLSSFTTAQWGYVVFGLMIVGSIILVMDGKSKGKTETLRETIRHDKRPLIGLFVVLPIIVIGYIWSFFIIF